MVTSHMYVAWRMKRTRRLFEATTRSDGRRNQDSYSTCCKDITDKDAPHTMGCRSTLGWHFPELPNLIALVHSVIMRQEEI